MFTRVLVRVTLYKLSVESNSWSASWTWSKNRSIWFDKTWAWQNDTTACRTLSRKQGRFELIEPFNFESWIRTERKQIAFCCWVFATGIELIELYRFINRSNKTSNWAQKASKQTEWHKRLIFKTDWMPMLFDGAGQRMRKVLAPKRETFWDFRET